MTLQAVKHSTFSLFFIIYNPSTWMVLFVYTTIAKTLEDPEQDKFP